VAFAKRDPATRQTRRVPKVLPSTGEIPDFPRGIQELYREQWEALWTSPIALAWDPVTDYGVIERLFILKHQYKLMSGMCETKPAEVQAMLAVGRELRLLEGQLGLTPRSRLALGLAIFAGKRSAGLDDYMEE
jgi:phage terminase small subunit